MSRTPRSIHWWAAPALVAMGAGVSAAPYATPEEAARRSFPEAVSFRAETLSLSAQELQAVTQTAGVPARSASWSALVALSGDGKPLGVVVLDSVLGKFELIDYAVGVAADGTVGHIEILTYRESHGQEVRLPAWRKQFVGKGPSAPLRVGEDIANISGATLSTNHVTDGVRRIVAVVATWKAHGKL